MFTEKGDVLENQMMAVFDFDHTIIDGNAGKGYIKYQLNKSMVRKIITILFIPLIQLLSFFKLTRLIGRSIPVYISTFGLSESKIQESADRFSSMITLFKDAIAAIEHHQNSGSKVLVITASPELIVNLVLKKNIQNFNKIVVIASKAERWFGGYVIKRFCKGENKVKMAMEQNVADNWGVGYSDDHADIPILERCRKRFLINPNQQTIQIIDTVFSDYQILEWT
jgi:phosphatidylglycerophosphatase C